ncbi:MAG: hypothetical protein ACQEWM_12475 [Actinomycetota bacterium]
MRWRLRDGTWRSGSHPARALVLLAAIVALLIVGLLGMHAMGGAGSGHGASSGGHAGIAVPVSAAHASHHDVVPLPHHAAAIDAAPASVAEHCTGDCQGAAPLSPGHAELMACVLALLVGLLVLVPPGRVGSSRLPSLRIPPPLAASAVLLEAPPPSLTLLSISRT